ncbi:MAG: peroxide stress protein YaaA [Actinobacteria bacterium]|uniref:Unannotated protein n=1 Tax=freshwater metagenome TaxID=449393 RepID=A0A6J6HWC1_9ZZZZ|nr:peroxide stress protein YaaA [Actinomycetota bacterium]
MLFLLPPSESKAVGGSPLGIDKVALIFAAMQPAREVVFEAAVKAKLVEPDLQSAPTLPAIDRYNGTLYAAIHGRGLKGTPTEFNELTNAERERAKESIFIQSALFGLIPATSLIPNYKFSADSKLPGLNLKQHWADSHDVTWNRLVGQKVIDLRSKQYAELAPIPGSFDSLTVEVFDIESAKAMNHFNKKAKGQFIRAFLQGAETLEDMAKAANLKIEIDGSAIKLFTNQR